eukprot:1656143-Pyramimonas_sp.AAC.1
MPGPLLAGFIRMLIERCFRFIVLQPRQLNLDEACPPDQTSAGPSTASSQQAVEDNDESKWPGKDVGDVSDPGLELRSLAVRRLTHEGGAESGQSTPVAEGPQEQWNSRSSSRRSSVKPGEVGSEVGGDGAASMPASPQTTDQSDVSRT